MIKKIEISKFGLFNDFKWNRDTQEATLEKLNIIYGRNYSGKTTLSRIFRCIEQGKLHKNYPEAKFSLTLANNHTLSETNLIPAENELIIRVYNSDFVKDNLSWLQNEDGTIQPFTILGSVNVDITNRIKEINDELGKEEDRTGLNFALSEKIKEYSKKYNEYKGLDKSLEDKLKEKAKEMKNASIYGVSPSYNIANIKSDIANATEDKILLEELIEEKKKLLKEVEKNILLDLLL